MRLLLLRAQLGVSALRQEFSSGDLCKQTCSVQWSAGLLSTWALNQSHLYCGNAVANTSSPDAHKPSAACLVEFPAPNDDF